MANQIMTVLEAHVTADKWVALVGGFAQIDAQRPPGLDATYLAQSTGDPTLWRTVGIWESQQAFDAFRTAVITPPPLALFSVARRTANAFSLRNQKLSIRIVRRLAEPLIS